MADEPIQATETPAPVVETSAPVVAAVEAPAVVEVAAVETPVVEAPKENLDAPTLLSKVDAPGVEAPKVDEPKTDVPKQDAKSDVPQEPKTPEVVTAPVEYKYELPETIKLDEGNRKEFHSALDEFRTNPETGAQKLVDLYNQEMTKYDEKLRTDQRKVWNETNTTWQNEVKADPIIGGAGHQTAMMAIARMRDKFASDAQPGTKEYDADINAFEGFLNATGAGNHPVFLKMWHRVSQYYDEPRAPTTTDIKPPKNANRGSGVNILHDNPRSSRN